MPTDQQTNTSPSFNQYYTDQLNVFIAQIWSHSMFSNPYKNVYCQISIGSHLLIEIIQTVLC